MNSQLSNTLISQLILGSYFLVLIVIGLASLKKIKNETDFFVAGKRGSTLQIAGTLLATLLGSSAILGSVELSFVMGLAGSWLLLSAAIGLILLIPFVKYIIKYGRRTFPELLGTLYNSNVKKISSVIIAVSWLGVVAAQIVGGGTVVSLFFGVNYLNGVIITALFFIFYTIIGGQISIIKTDLIQSIFIIAGISVFLIFLPVGDEIKGTIREFNFPFNKNFSPLDLLILLFTYSSTYLVGPDVYSRLFCAKDKNCAVNGIIITVIFMVFIAFSLSIIGVVAKTFYEADIKLSGITPLLFLSKEILPYPVFIIIGISLLSVIISSADSILLNVSIIISDLFPHKNKIFLTRIFVLIFGFLSLLVAIKIKSIIGLILLGLTIFSGGFFIPTILGLIGMRFRSNAVIPAIISGSIIALCGKIVQSGIIKIENGGFIGNIIIISAFVINFAILMVFRIRRKEYCSPVK
jgi:SSS family solute:Na+ symporter